MIKVFQFCSATILFNRSISPLSPRIYVHSICAVSASISDSISGDGRSSAFITRNASPLRIFRIVAFPQRSFKIRSICPAKRDPASFPLIDLSFSIVLFTGSSDSTNFLFNSANVASVAFPSAIISNSLNIPSRQNISDPAAFAALISFRRSQASINGRKSSTTADVGPSAIFLVAPILQIGPAGRARETRVSLAQAADLKNIGHLGHLMPPIG
jgi:hypothetical protein